MNSATSRALDKLEAGKWDVVRALDAIRAGGRRSSRRQASWLKVRVVEKGEKKFSFTLPLGLASLAATALSPLVKYGLRKAARKGNFSMVRLEDIDLRKILKVLKSYGPLTLVEFSDEQNEVLVKLL